VAESPRVCVGGVQVDDRVSEVRDLRSGIAVTRAAVSIPANIAEGFGKRNAADKARYFNIAQGSLEESRYYLILARDLSYCDPTLALDHLVSASRLLRAYRTVVLRNIPDLEQSLRHS